MPKFILEEVAKNIPKGIYYLILAYVVWKVAQFYFVRFRDVEKKICDISDIKKKIDEEITPSLVKINSTSDRIARYLIMRDALDPIFFTSGSPIELNEFAIEILEISGAKNFVDSSLDFLCSRIKERNPKSALDIQQFAISVIFELVETEAFSKIKDFVYQNPKYKGHDIDIPVIINIATLYLRNEYFKKYPELKETNPE